MKDFEFISDIPNIVWFNNHKVNFFRIDAGYYKKQYLESEIALINSGLVLKKLNDISILITQGPNPNFLENLEGIPCLKTRNVYDKEINFEGCNYISLEEFNRYSKFQLQYQDILISILGEGSIGKCNIYTSSKKSLFNRPIGLVRINDCEIDKFFISIYLRSKLGKDSLERGISGSSGQKVLSIEYLKNILIPIPSLEIQKYIGDKVRKAEELREEAKKVKKETEEIFNNSINEDKLMALLKHDESNKYNWVNELGIDNNRLDAEYNQNKYTVLNNFFKDNGFILKQINCFINEKIVSGSTPKGANYIQSGIPFVRSTNQSDYTINDDLVYISYEESEKLKGSEIKEGDIVYAIAGSIGVGSASIVPEHMKKSNINQALVRLRLKNINNYYFIFIANSNIGKLLSARLANGAVQLNLNREEVGNIAIPILNNDLQECIGRKIKKYIELLRESKQQIKDAKKDIEDLIEGNFDMFKIKENN